MSTKPAIENSNMHGEYQLQERGKQTIAEQNIDKAGSVASFCARETIFLGGESCFLDVDSLVPISALKKETCRRIKSYPPVVRTAPSYHHERLLPRRPRLNRERQSALPQNGKSLRYNGRRQRSLGKSLSVEPSKMSVARRRHFEQEGLSTRRVHNLPPLAEKITRRKNIFLPANLSPLQVPQASLTEQEEFQNWKRKFLEGTVKNCRKVKSINCVKTSSNQSKMTENQSKTGKNNSRIPHEAGVTQQFFAKSKASSDVNTAKEATIKTKGIPIAEKAQEITTQSSRPPFPDTSLSPTTDLKEKTRAVLLGSMSKVKQERKVIQTYSEEDCTSITSEFPRRSEIPDIEIADKTVGNDSFPWKTENNSKSFHLKYAKKYQSEALDRFHEGKYQPELESQSNVHSEQELNGKSRADLLLVKKLNKRRLLFRLARQERNVETEPNVDRLSNHFVNTNNATKDDGASLQYKNSKVDLALVDTNGEEGSPVCKYEACAASKEPGKPSQVNPYSFMTPNRKNGTCSEPVHVNTFQEKGSYHTPSDRSGRTANDIGQFQNYCSVIRGRREGQCIKTVSEEKLRFLRVIQKRL